MLVGVSDEVGILLYRLKALNLPGLFFLISVEVGNIAVTV